MIQTAVAAALRTIDRNLQTFAHTYPGDATENGIYPVRQARLGHPAGSNTGWTTGFWPGQLWLSYDLTRDVTYRRAGEVQVERFADASMRKWVSITTT